MTSIMNSRMAEFLREHVQECKKCVGAFACLSGNWHMCDVVQCSVCTRIFVTRAREMQYRPSLFITPPPCALYPLHKSYVCRTCGHYGSP